MVGGAILRPPRDAVIGLIQWAVDLWPYVNGKGLMSGMQLANMELSDMLDAVHFLFEEDARFVSQEQNAFMDTFRTNIYRELYIYISREREREKENFGVSPLL